jgi:hypothetical protein
MVLKKGTVYAVPNALPRMRFLQPILQRRFLNPADETSAYALHLSITKAELRYIAESVTSRGKS